MPPEDFLYEDDVTGGVAPKYRIVKRRFDKYEVTLLLGLANELLDIIGIEIAKDFLSHKQRIQSTGYHDVADLCQ